MPIRKLLAISLFAALVSLQGCKKQNVAPPVSEERNPAEVKVTQELANSLRVGLPVSGCILKILGVEGQVLRPGTVLATLHSTSLSDTQVALIKSYSEQTLAAAATKRAEQLVAADVIGRAELERRQAELLHATTEVASFTTQLRGLGMCSDIQRPLAIVVIGGLVSSTALTLLLVPALYAFFEGDKEITPPVHHGFI
jgi:cobalt-zinc-cadmium efflux system membrane fusion protein